MNEHGDLRVLSIGDTLRYLLLLSVLGMTCFCIQVCIVTGANAGIGLATAKLLAARGGHIVMACRSRERASKAADIVRQVSVRQGCSVPKVPRTFTESGHCDFPPTSRIKQAQDEVNGDLIRVDVSMQVDVMELDLASLNSVTQFCNSFAKKKLSASLLVCNAGIMRPPKRLETKDGMEMQFQVNRGRNSTASTALELRVFVYNAERKEQWMKDNVSKVVHF